MDDTKRPSVVASCRGNATSHNDGGVLNDASNDYNNNNINNYNRRPPGSGRVDNTTSALPTRAGYCLWCRPAPAGRQHRCPAAVAADFLPCRKRHSVHHAAPHGRETAVATTGRAQPPKPWKQVRTRLKEHPYASSNFRHRHSNQPKADANRRRGRTPHHEEVLRSSSLSPRNVFIRGAAVVDEPSRANPVEQIDSPDIDFAEENDGRMKQGDGGHGCAAPRAFFCSWECAGRWNVRFSPVQARHERGLRIDIAAGRVVTR